MSYKRFTKKDRYGHWCTDTKINDRYIWSEDGKVWERDLTHYAFDGEAIDRLAELEDKIENGTLIELPCAIGSTIYLVPSETQFRLNNIGESFKKHNRVYEMEVYQIYMNKNNYVLYNFEQTASALGSSFGETWFLTKAEAEKKLEELSKKP